MRFCAFYVFCAFCAFCAFKKLKTGLMTSFTLLLGDVIYDRAFNELFHQRLESIEYNVVIAIMGAIRRTSSEKLFQDVDLENYIYLYNIS